MKNKGTVTIGVIIFTIVVIVVIVASLVGSFALKSDIPTPTNTNPPLPTYTPDPCTPENIKPIVLDFNRNSRAFDDLSVLAQSTPRENLVPIITQLQDIRRKSEDFVGPSCIAQLQEYQLSYMNTFINTLVALYSSLTSELTENDVNLINQGMSLSIQYHDKYLVELARLLGVTLEPTVTVSPTEISVTATP